MVIRLTPKSRRLDKLQRVEADANSQRCLPGRYTAVPSQKFFVLSVDATAVTNEIGAIKFYSRLPVVDMLGLTDDTVSAIRFHSFRTYGVGSSPWSAVSVASYILERKPDAIFLPAVEPLTFERRRVFGGDNMHPLWKAIVTDPRFNRYEAVMAMRINQNKYGYLFLAPGVRLGTTMAKLDGGRCLEAWPITIPSPGQ